MLIRKLLKGHFFVKAVSVSNLNNGELAEIEFHRMGRWSIFGFREHINRRYVRKFYWKWTDKLQRNNKFTVCRSFNLFQYYYPTPNELIFRWLMNLLTWSWIVYIIALRIIK